MENVLLGLNIHCQDGRIGVEASCDIGLSGAHLWHVNCPLRDNRSILDIEHVPN
jgi:hypothetical protein